VVFFLVDGLSTSALSRELKVGHLPNLRKHFLKDGQNFFRAHSIFPSLTYPNISSLLHEEPIHLTGALGNTLIDQGRVISFESVLDRPFFTRQMHGNNIFTRLNARGAHTVSLDYGLGADATVASDALDLKVGLALEVQDYLYLDEKRIDALSLILKKNPVEQWPEFIFIHLVGFDFLSHQEGAGSKKSQQYLEVLDDRLGPVFQALQNAESGSHKVISLLGADHGFNPVIQERFKIDDLVKSVEPRLQVFNEGRMAAVYSPSEPTQEQLFQWSQDLLRNRALDLVAYRTGNKVHIRSQGKEVQFEFQASELCPYKSQSVSVNAEPAYCPHQLPTSLRDLYYPYLIENLSFYFQSKKHADLILIPKPKVVFGDSEAGYHGGPTDDEVITPLLMRNATLKDPQQIPAIWEILQFL
jgi:hypothetical protein